MRKHRGLMLAATLLFLAWTGAALAEEAPELIEEAPDLIEEASDPAEEAPDLTGLCTFDSNGRTRNPAEMLDGDLGTYFPLKEKKGEVIISCPEPLSAVYIQVFDKYGRDYDYDLQIRRGGEWQTVDRGGKYLSTLHTLPEPAEEVKIVATARERLRIAEIRAFGAGQVPPEIQRWETLEKCDILLLSAHPDDEILWFAGLMPTYGGDRGYRLQVAVMAPTGGQRKLELLGAVWHCGVRYYPEMLGFIDKNGQNPESQYTLWRGKGVVLGKIAAVIRKHRPEVMVTHGEKGEYGHGAHKTAADAAKTLVKQTNSAKKYPKSAQQYGTWQVKKLYLHEYEKNTVECDWTEPLAAFGGKTGYEVAEEAFRFHASQVKRDWNFEIHGQHDNALFGLFYTAVGPDTGKGDLMEHIEITE